MQQQIEEDMFGWAKQVDYGCLDGNLIDFLKAGVPITRLRGLYSNRYKKVATGRCSRIGD